jgi:hypothetical protein
MGPYTHAKPFAEQAQVLRELEDLLTRRFQASTELAQLDGQVLCFFAATFYQLTGDQGEQLKTSPLNEAQLLEFQALLHGRKHVAATLAQLDEALLTVFHKMDVVLPPGFDLLNPAGHAAT